MQLTKSSRSEFQLLNSQDSVLSAGQCCPLKQQMLKKQQLSKWSLITMACTMCQVLGIHHFTHLALQARSYDLHFSDLDAEAEA